MKKKKKQTKTKKRPVRTAFLYLLSNIYICHSCGRLFGGCGGSLISVTSEEGRGELEYRKPKGILTRMVRWATAYEKKK